ncbi:PQQ-dependent sugar dehydrogenase [Agrobacterium tumefaciens]|nr:PQQ-dependent sugar dehydrogenase [Agrobacterium tumefaciens]
MAQVNEGSKPAEKTLPFKIETIAQFATPWAIAFIPDGRILVTEKEGRLFLTTQAGEKLEVSGVPVVQYSGQNGLLDIAAAPDFKNTRSIYLSFVEPGREGSGLALARAQLVESEQRASLANLEVIWRQLPKGSGSQPGGVIAFSPDGKHLFLTSVDRRRPQTAQDLNSALGKVIRLKLDGSTPQDNPLAAQGGVAAQIWARGHRNPYGLAFAPNGSLWLHEMGPNGGDELNLIKSGRNYGWPVVSNGDNYDGSEIPDHKTHPEFEAPAIYWTPVIAPAGLALYSGQLFSNWEGSALIGELAGRGLIRIQFDGEENARQADRWDLGARIRDVDVAKDGSIWLLEDGQYARLMKLMPK